MNTWTSYDFTWRTLVGVSFILLLIYLILLLLLSFINNLGWGGTSISRIKFVLNRLKFLSEPIFLIIIIGCFILIDPITHGILVSFLVIVLFKHLRNYFSGLFFRLDPDTEIGHRIVIQQHGGIILKSGLLQLHLKTSKGLHRIPYQELYDKGYTIMSTLESGGYYLCQLTAQKERDHQAEHLKRVLATAPYIDWKQQVDINHDSDNPMKLSAKILLREEVYVEDFIRLLEENGYNCKITPNT